MNILLTIAARGGSKGVKNKNIRNLRGKPLIAHSIEQAKRWGKAKAVVVSTDSDEIAGVARQYGADVPFARPAELATDTANKIEVLRHALVESEKHYGMKFDAVLDLDATAPIRTIEDIDNIVRLFEERKPDCAFSVVKSRKNPYFNMVETEPDGTVSVCKKVTAHPDRRQDAPSVYSMNTSLYVYKRDFLVDEGNKLPYDKKTIVYEMPEISAVDIDSELDLKYIEFLVNEGVVRL